MGHPAAVSQHVYRMRKKPKAAKHLKKYELGLKSKDPDDGSAWIDEPSGGSRMQRCNAGARAKKTNENVEMRFLTLLKPTANNFA